MKKIFILTLLSFFGCKNEPICSVNENNAGKEIYDLDEATCFIALKLNKKASDLNLIHDALIAEENYMNKIGLISEYQISEDENKRIEILKKCLSKKNIPKSQYLKFGECMAYFANTRLFPKYMDENEVKELHRIWKNFKS